MSGAFFSDLAIPQPDVDLGIGSGTHAEQVGRTMIEFEKVLKAWQPDWVVVVGDVNATCACSITAKKECVKLAHIESGLRSFDMRMPEEVNRIVTDRLADLLFTPDSIADDNLLREGVPEGRIKQVGNIMVDTLDQNRPAAERLSVREIVAANLLENRSRDIELASSYALITMHRPSNVDRAECLRPLALFLAEELAGEMPLIWPVHPRTRKQLEAFHLWDQLSRCERLYLVKPLGYREMLRLTIGARIVLTDSGGLQEECCIVGTPCVTLRENTERPITLIRHGGVSLLTASDVASVQSAIDELKCRQKAPFRPPLWDGHTAARIVNVLTSVAQN
jgi:UDP-N-acetylglucosamine 2-epimerase (non-hydrolysing)